MEQNKNEIIISTQIHKKNNKNRAKTPKPSSLNKIEKDIIDREYKQLKTTADNLMDQLLFIRKQTPNFKEQQQVEYKTNNQTVIVQQKKGTYNTVVDFNTNKDVVLRLSNTSSDFFGIEKLEQESINSAFNDVFISSLLALCGEPTKKSGKSYFNTKVPYFFMEKAETDAQSIVEAINEKLKNKQNLNEWEKTHYLLFKLMWLFSTTEMQPAKWIIQKKDEKTNTILEETTKELTEEDKINVIRDTFYEDGFSKVKNKIARLFLRVFLLQMGDRKPANTLLFTKTKKGETKEKDILFVEADFDDVDDFYGGIFGQIIETPTQWGGLKTDNHKIFDDYFKNLLNQYHMFKQVLQEKSIERNLRNIIKKVGKINNLPNELLLTIKNLSIEIRKKSNKDIEQTQNLLKQHTKFAQQLKNINLNIVDVVEQIDENLFNYEIETEFLDCFKEITKRQYTMTPDKLLTLVEDIAKKCRHLGLSRYETNSLLITQLKKWHNMLCCVDGYCTGYLKSEHVKECMQNIAKSCQGVDFIKEARDNTLAALNTFMEVDKQLWEESEKIKNIMKNVYRVKRESLKKNHSYIKLNTKRNITGLSGGKNNSINK